MKKLSLCSCFVRFFSFSANAQIYGGATLGFRLRWRFWRFADRVWDQFKWQIHVQRKHGCRSEPGYNRFGGEEWDFDEGIDISYSMIPITGLFEYHFGGDVSTLCGARSWPLQFRVKWKYDGGSESDRELYFGLALLLGFFTTE
jgi:hypothetical protein